MKAVLFEKPGTTSRLKLAEVDRPVPREDEVLLRVRYCGVNPLDLLVLSGTAPARPMPHILGSEVAATVEQVGPDAVGLAEGQEVVVYHRLFDGTCPHCLRGEEQTCVNGGIVGVGTQGGYAEFLKVPAANALPLPAGLSREVAAAAALSAPTAWHLVLHRGRLTAGETMVVFGASGGVGSFAVQTGHLAGARVIAVTRDIDKASYLEELGADTVLESGEDVAKWVRDATDGLGADLVVDPVGRSTWPGSFASVAPNGRWATCGALTGRRVELDLGALYSRQVEVIGSTGGSRADVLEVLPEVAQGRLTPPIWKTFPLEEAPQALDSLSDPARRGKVLLTVG